MTLRWSRYLPMYRAFPQGTPSAIARLLAEVEVAVPGARARPAKGSIYPYDAVDVPKHGAAAFHAWAQTLPGVTGCTWQMREPPRMGYPAHPEAELRLGGVRLFDWQVKAADDLERQVRVDGYRGVALRVACGGGKTLVAIDTVRRFPGPVLIIGPAKARSAWESDLRDYLTVRPHVIYPQAERREADLTLAEYLDECRGLPAVRGIQDRWSRVLVRYTGDLGPQHPAVQHVLGRVRRMGRLVDAAHVRDAPPARISDWNCYVLLGAQPDGWECNSRIPFVHLPVPSPQRPWVIGGHEVLADVLREITTAGFRPSFLVWDEWHAIVEAGIWGMQRREVGKACPGCGAQGARGEVAAEDCREGCPGGRFYLEGTAASNAGSLLQPREIRSAAAFMLATMDSVEVRLGVTATIPVAAKQENLLMPLNLVHPYCWGKRRNFQIAYASGRIAEPGHPRAGYWTTGPNSRVEDLAARCAPFMVAVPVEVSHADVLPLKIQITWLPPAAQGKRPKLAQEELGGEEGSGVRRGKAQAQAKAREGRKLRGLASVRRAAIKNACDVLEAGHKVVVFTTRLSEALLLHEDLAKAAPKGALVTLADGSVPTREREGLRDAWLAFQGPAALVATGYAWATSANGLQKAIKIIQTGLPDDIVHQLQWIGRGHRQHSRCGTYEILIGEGTFFEDAARELEARCGDLRRLFDPAHATEVETALADMGSLDDIVADIAADPWGRRRGSPA